MGSMGSIQPINFQRRVLNPMFFKKLNKLSYIGTRIVFQDPRRPIDTKRTILACNWLPRALGHLSRASSQNPSSISQASPRHLSSIS